MSDLETIKAMLQRANIEFKEERGVTYATVLRIERGYMGFFSQISFSADGSLADVAAFE